MKIGVCWTAPCDWVQLGAKTCLRVVVVTSLPASASHWDGIYSSRSFSDVSWFEPEPDTSLALLDECGVKPGDSVLDVGAGASFLIDRLVDLSFSDVTALDVSDAALEIARHRLEATLAATWVVHDLLTWKPDRRYDVWHDSAVFHFLTAQADRERYRSVLHHALASGGLAIIGIFAADGPDHCSGLPVERYDPDALVEELGPDFDRVLSRRIAHTTPEGVVQPFAWVAARRSAAVFASPRLDAFPH